MAVEQEKPPPDGKHVDQTGHKVQYKSLLQKRTRRDEEETETIPCNNAQGIIDVKKAEAA